MFAKGWRVSVHHELGPGIPSMTAYDADGQFIPRTASFSDYSCYRGFNG